MLYLKNATQSKVRREMDKYGCSPENYLGIVIWGGLWAGKEKGFLWFLGSGFQGGKPSKDSKAEAILRIPWRNSRCWAEIPGQVWTGLELILKKKKKINILNNRCKLLCIYIHILPQVPLNTLLNIKLCHLIWVCCMGTVSQSRLTLCNPMDCRPPGSSVHGILQARTLEWVAISSFKWSSQLRDCKACLRHCRWILYYWTTGGCPWSLAGGAHWNRNSCIHLGQMAPTGEVKDKRKTLSMKLLQSLSTREDL